MRFKNTAVLLSVLIVLEFCATENGKTLSNAAKLTEGHQTAEKWADETLATLLLLRRRSAR